MTRKIDTNRRGYWLEKITEWQNSGKSAKEWCKENQTSFQGLYKWKRKLNEEAPKINSNSFIELKNRPFLQEIEIEYKKYKFKRKRETNPYRQFIYLSIKPTHPEVIHVIFVSYGS